MDSFLKLFASGIVTSNVINHMLDASYFIHPKHVTKTIPETLMGGVDHSLGSLPDSNCVLNNQLGNNDKIPARFSKSQSFYFDAKGNPIPSKYMPNAPQAHQYSKHNDVFVHLPKNPPIKVLIDYDGNKEVRRLIKHYTGHIVSAGANNTIFNATISHVWGGASNPLLFTSLWNVVIVPTYCNFFLDIKNLSPYPPDYQQLVKNVREAFQSICIQLYNVNNTLTYPGYDLGLNLNVPTYHYPLNKLHFI